MLYGVTASNITFQIIEKGVPLKSRGIVIPQCGEMPSVWKMQNLIMNRKTKQTIRFLLGTGCVMAALVGAFFNMAWYFFAILFAGGCGLMGQRSMWEKVALIIRGK